MRRLSMILLAIFLSACGPTPPDLSQPQFQATAVAVPGIEGVVSIYHDDLRSVTCWVYDGFASGGIFCMTDAEIKTGLIRDH